MHPLDENTHPVEVELVNLPGSSLGYGIYYRYTLHVAKYSKLDFTEESLVGSGQVSR